ncbi:MAG: energy transducer TonB [Henriciella sp.]
MADILDKSLRHSLKRTCTVVIPAGAMTLALFATMQQLVAVEDFEPPAQTFYTVEALMEQEIDEPLDKPREKVVRETPIKAPPPPPKLVNSVNNPKVPFSDYSGTAPADYGQADFRKLKPQRTTAISVRNLQPLTPPIPAYPSAAASRGLEGTCEVFFSVSIRGDPFNVDATCTDRVFRNAAIKAVKRVKFAPKIRDGLPVTVNGVVYPLEFRMEP